MLPWLILFWERLSNRFCNPPAGIGSHSATRAIRPGSHWEGVEVAALCRPVKFFSTKLRKSFLSGPGFVHKDMAVKGMAADSSGSFMFPLHTKNRYVQYNCHCPHTSICPWHEWKAIRPLEGAGQSQVGMARTSTVPSQASNSHFIPVQSPPDFGLGFSINETLGLLQTKSVTDECLVWCDLRLHSTRVQLMAWERQLFQRYFFNLQQVCKVFLLPCPHSLLAAPCCWRHQVK